MPCTSNCHKISRYRDKTFTLAAVLVCCLLQLSSAGPLSSGTVDGPPTPPGQAGSTSSSNNSIPPFGRPLGSSSQPDPLTSSEAASLMLEVVYEFNACVPYAGVPPPEGERVGPEALATLTALLPMEVQGGSSMSSDDVKQVRVGAEACRGRGCFVAVSTKGKR